MAGVQVRIDADTMDELRGAFTRLAEHCRNLTPCLKDIGEDLLRSTDKRFDEHLSPEGSPWEDISPQTKEKKQGRFGEGKILTDSGRLRRSITYSTEHNGLLVGTNVIYAAIHQLGGETGRGHTMPARPFLGISDRDKESALEIVAEYLCRAMK
ncbi:MAG: phage virion morphogenesis protein [Magnetococcales bacterium]|nr:phage virion morphogenesis protein [Magnetococcales bacterium]